MFLLPLDEYQTCTEVYIFNRSTMINNYDSIVVLSLKSNMENIKIIKNFKESKIYS